jgi:hypothetical protein
MSTFTASELSTSIKQGHIGVLSACSKLTLAITGTASSVVYLAKIPHGATIVDFAIYAVDAGANNTWKIGLQLPHAESGGSNTFTVTESALMTETANTTGVMFRWSSLKLPYRVSISDNVLQRWARVQMVCTAAISASADIRSTILYTMDDQT